MVLIQLWLSRAVRHAFLFLLMTANVTSSSSSVCTTQKHFDDHPVLCEMLDEVVRNPHKVAHSIQQHALENNQLVGHWWSKKKDQGIIFLGESKQRWRKLASTKRKFLSSSPPQLPVVFTHGMGDSCFNSGMQYITQKTGELLGVYSVCIPTGADRTEDTNSGYFKNMNANVDSFAIRVANDTQLQNGFHAIGFSQGCNLIRGYIARYNFFPVHSFLSVNGVNAGVGAVPHCRPSRSLKQQQQQLSFSLCELLMEQASRAAYTEFAQEHSFQANYWRDPRPSAFPRYQKYAQLAVWNNEAGFINETLRENWSKTQTFVWIMATEDTMVFPREGEHWAAPNPQDPFGTVLPMNQTEWFRQDLFGLKTAQEAGKNYFEVFEGEHLAFTEEDFVRWVHTYLMVE